MKRNSTYWLCSLLLVMSTSLSGQEKKITQNETQIETLLCHKWKLMYGEAKGKRRPISSSGMNMSMQFNNDHVFVSEVTVSEKKLNYKGKWSFDYQTMILTTDENNGESPGMGKLKIVKITDSELVFESDMYGKTGMIFKRLK